jgi:Zn ribbon nucleic-acid-binding protein
VRAKARASQKRWLADPINKAAHVQRSAENLAAWRETSPEHVRAVACANLAHANKQEHRAKRNHSIRAAAHEGVPEHRWGEVVKLTRTLGAEGARAAVITDEKAKERKRLASLPPLERQLEKLRNGAKLVEVRPLPSRALDFTPGGVATGML